MPNLKWGEVKGRWDMRFVTITLSVASSRLTCLPLGSQQRGAFSTSMGLTGL